MRVLRLLREGEAVSDKITIVSGDDWEGVYRNGRLVCEGHIVNCYEALRSLGYPVKCVTADQDWLEDNGRLPDRLSEVVEAKPE